MHALFFLSSMGIALLCCSVRTKYRSSHHLDFFFLETKIRLAWYDNVRHWSLRIALRWFWILFLLYVYCFSLASYYSLCLRTYDPSSFANLHQLFFKLFGVKFHCRKKLFLSLAFPSFSFLQFALDIPPVFLNRRLWTFLPFLPYLSITTSDSVWKEPPLPHEFHDKLPLLFCPLRIF